MSSSKEDSLSPEELRKRLYRTFKNKGVLDRLKVQLRNQLIQELNHPLSRGQNPGPVPLNGTSETLLLSACNSMVADHLRTLGHEYTLSVFCPESGLSNDKILKKEDLLRILNLSPSSAIFTSMLNEENGDKGFLFSLLAGLAHHSTHSLRHDVDTQTTNLASYEESLVDKMKMIDKRYESLALGEDKIFPLQSKLSAYKKEIEAQKEAEMKAKLKHFKDVEIAKVRMEEKSKFNEEFEKLKQELERTYEMKAKALMEREKNAIERLQKQQEIEEKNIYMQRQSVLKEIETQRSRDNELRMRMEAFENSCQIHTEKVKASEELLRRRELAVRTMEDTYDQKMKNELSRYQLELKEEFLKRTEKLTESENRNKVETARIQKESEMIDARLEEHQRACAELKRLQVELETAQQQISLLTQQKELLMEQLESTSDYSSLKMEKAELLGQLQLLQKQLEEAQEENKRLHAEMMKPSKEELALHAEISRLKNTRTLDEVEFENQKQVLQAQLQREMEQCVYLKAQLTECEKRSEWMAKHVEEIKTQLCHTQQALENEVLRNPKPSLVDRSVLELSADKLVPPDIYMDGSVLRPRASYHDVCEAGGTSRGLRSPWNDSPDSDFELVAEAKARVLELQKEAESLEEAYRKYQQRAVHTILSPRPLSPQQAYSSLYPSSLLRKKDYQDSHNYSSHKPKTLLNQLTPHYVQSMAMASNETRHILPPVHEQPQAIFVSDHSPNSLSEPVSLKEGQSQKKQSVSAKRSPQSSSRGRLHKEHSEEPAVSLMPFSQTPLSDKPALFRASVTTPGDFSELSPPHSPQHRSTARDQSSPPKVEPVFSSSASSPQPEKINLEDLTGELQESGHIPELLPDTAVPLAEEAPKRPTTPQPQDLPEDPTYSQTQAVKETLDKSIEDEEEEQRWERERKEKREKRQKELQEAKEREQQELERLEKEMLLEEAVQSENKEEIDIGKGKDNEQNKEEPKEENPLEKYMKMVLEAREKQQEKTSVRVDEGGMSPEDKSLFEEKDESIAAYLKDEDGEFW